MADNLKTLLEQAEIATHPGQEYFVPINSQREIVTSSSISACLQDSHPHFTDQQRNDLADHIEKHARKLFAILVVIDNTGEICNLLNEGITDKHLPFRRGHDGDERGRDPQMRFFTTELREIRSMSYWGQRKLREFGKEQFRMLAAEFAMHLHQDLERGMILPFTRHPNMPNDDVETFGGYSVVNQRRLHPSHHSFWSEDINDPHYKVIAVKRLNSTDPREFQKEVEILKTLHVKQHAHLVKLLTTYSHLGYSHLLFPWADANLRNYWNARPEASFEAEVVMWSLRQMKGIASAINVIHNFRPTTGISMSAPRGSRYQKDASLNVNKDDKRYGRHGDIKPENLLWFANSPDTTDARGILQLADFGLGRFHGRDTRSKIRPTAAQATPTYEPPECPMRQLVSRKYDVWSLGCVYLEFVVWLLLGGKALEEFADRRGKVDKHGIDEDKFFTIIYTADGRPQTATVADGVWKTVGLLRAHPSCSGLIHALLDLIMDSMLVPAQTARMTASQLHERLRELYDRSIEDVTFAVAPARQVTTATAQGSLTRKPSNASTWPTHGRNGSNGEASSR